MNQLNVIFHILCNKAIITNALKIALVVGIILNLINQGDVIIQLDFGNIHFLKFGLTFLVPFCVSTYTAVSMKIKCQVGEKALFDATLKCNRCQKTHEIHQNEIIPFCTTCQEQTSWKIKNIRK